MCLIFARSSLPSREKSFMEEKQASGKPNLSWKQRWLAIFPAHPAVTVSRAASSAFAVFRSALCGHACPFKKSSLDK